MSVTYCQLPRPPTVDLITIANRTRRSPKRRVEDIEEIRLLDTEVPPTPVSIVATTTTSQAPPAVTSSSALSPEEAMTTPSEDSDKDKAMVGPGWANWDYFYSSSLSSSPSSQSSSSPLLNNLKEVVAPPPTTFCVDIACIEHPDIPRCNTFFFSKPNQTKPNQHFSKNLSP